jgi:ring-1,2-phenylacetyl-CoA epoxidase subunit PaaB
VSDTQWPRYEVFEQERPGQPHRNAGAVHAPDPEIALQNARDVFVRRPDSHSLWVAPADQILSRTAEEVGNLTPLPPSLNGKGVPLAKAGGSGRRPGEGEGAKPRQTPGAENEGASDGGAGVETYLIFQKQSQRQGETFVTHVGEVEATSAEAALGMALERFGGEAVYVWWVVPERAITRSEPADAEPFFAPARDKPFRLPRHYHVLTQMREVRATATGGPEEGGA